MTRGSSPICPMALNRVRVIALQRDWWAVVMGTSAFQGGEILVQIDADLPEIVIEAEGVSRGDGRRAARPSPLHEDHALPGPEGFHGREHEPDLPDVEQEPGPLEGVDEAQPGSERPELPAGFQDRDGKAAGEPGRGGRASRPAPDDDGALHPSPPSGRNSARQESYPSVNLRTNLRSPPPASPVRTPRSRDETKPQISGV